MKELGLTKEALQFAVTSHKFGIVENDWASFVVNVEAVLRLILAEVVQDLVLSSFKRVEVDAFDRNFVFPLK
jgi:hypothetical protein